MRSQFARLVGPAIGMLLLGLATGCANKVPPNLNPLAVRAWYGTEVIKGLDVIRDAAIAANTVQPPVLSTADTRSVVRWHQSAVSVIKDVPYGWQPAVLTGLAELMDRGSPGLRYTIGPYAELAKTLIGRTQ
jgi:hypothetical protein